MGGGEGVGPVVTVHFDGGSRGNPGPAGIGVVVLDEKKRPLYELAEFLGNRTSNFAEYTALVRGLTAAKALKASRVEVKADSELVVRQINGVYKVKSPDLLPLYRQAMGLIGELGNVRVTHVYREGNARADELANLAMDRMAKVEPLGPPGTIGGGQRVEESAAGASGGEGAAAAVDDATLKGLGRLAEVFAAAGLVDEKLTVEQLRILALIGLRPGRTAAEIGDEMKRTAGAVMKAIGDALIVRGELVYSDSRRGEEHLFVTEKGERLLRQMVGEGEEA
ncbi:MAG: reverse transcriptase-like protein [Phycisphaerae bacterium]